VLAGGRAARYNGVVKGTLRLPDGSRILDRILGALAAAGIVETVICARDAEPYGEWGAPVVADLRPGLGPLGGIEAALAALKDRCGAVLFVPCDVPGLTAREVSAMVAAHAAIGPGRIAAARTAGFFWQPLCVVVPTAFAGEVAAALDRGERSVGRLWRALGAEPVDFDDARPFFNVNTPEDLAAWAEGEK
jgi:molybdenum cofactor guanylyltransferase